MNILRFPDNKTREGNAVYKIYRRFYPSIGSTVAVKADLAQATAPIYGVWQEPGNAAPEFDSLDWNMMPFQTATAKHRIANAFNLVKTWGG